tara:strand:- start:818 stop:1051 length:234 start_codon:yes stop_codon:yes gene_type:complete
MGRPRKYKRPQIRRKCQHCGKMAWLPYTRTIVPPQGFSFEIQPPKKEKELRADRRGAEKCSIKHYCNEMCYSESISL